MKMVHRITTLLTGSDLGTGRGTATVQTEGTLHLSAGNYGVGVVLPRKSTGKSTEVPCKLSQVWEWSKILTLSFCRVEKSVESSDDHQ